MKRSNSSLPSSWKMRRPTAPTSAESLNDGDDDNEESYDADPVSSRKAARAAIRASASILENSRVLSQTCLDDVPQFKAPEIRLGKLLGKGGFSDVYEISSINLRRCSRPNSFSDDADGVTTSDCLGLGLNSSFQSSLPSLPALDGDDETVDDIDAVKDWKEAQSMSRRRLAESASESSVSDQDLSDDGTTGTNPIASTQNQLREGQYCLKHLSSDTMSNPTKFKTGAVDLVIESTFLSCLDHPHIIKLRGVTCAGPMGFATGRPSGYFLIMDRVYDTLEDRIRAWSSDHIVKDNSARSDSSSGGSRRLLKNMMEKMTFGKSRDSLVERMKIAPEISSALSYLHRKGIIFRDLKPDNIGFDCQGKVKLFDFGLAKELNALEAGPDGTYLLSGNTGSLRYMSPEIARHEAYNLSADVYSYSILLWQILSLTKPYDGMDRNSHADRVVYGIERPRLPLSWPESLRTLLKYGWHPNLRHRPSMQQVHDRIVSILISLDGDHTSAATEDADVTQLPSSSSPVTKAKAPVRAVAA